jgi:hexosaminidase
LKDGYHVVFQTWLESYLDYPHVVVPLRSVYRAQSLKDLPPETAKRVLGTQGALWTEYVADERRLQFNVFPRLAAKAEVGWSVSSSQRGIGEFKARWQALRPHLEQMGLTHAAPLAASDPGLARQLWDLLRDLRRGDLLAEQARWEKRARRKT